MALSLTTKKLWLQMLIAALVSLPIISTMDGVARADYIPPTDSGQPADDDGRFGSSR